jgi:hypothetical protein
VSRCSVTCRHQKQITIFLFSLFCVYSRPPDVINNNVIIMRSFFFVRPSPHSLFFLRLVSSPEIITKTNVTTVKPIYVDILNSSLTLVADRKYEIHCVTSGSRPDAIITWLKGKKSLKRIRDFSKNNQTTSILNFVPSIEDNGKTLTCHAENPNVAGMFIQDNWNMSVFCKCLG